MIETIAQITLFLSISGLVAISARKIGILKELPKANLVKGGGKNLFLALKEKIKTINPFKNFINEIFLQKILSKIRIMALKAENKISAWLASLRERQKNKKEVKKDNYWEEIKKIKDEK